MGWLLRATLLSCSLIGVIASSSIEISRRHVCDEIRSRSPARSSIQTHGRMASITRFPEKADIASKATSIRAGAIDVRQSEILGIGFFIAADVLLRKALVAHGIKFPSQLAGCMLLFATMVFANVVTSSPLSNDLYGALTPGATWLTNWLPVFFVPGLVMLPMAPSFGSAIEVVKVLSVVFVGFIFTLTTTASAVYGVNRLLGLTLTRITNTVKAKSVFVQSSVITAQSFSPATLKVLLSGATVTGAIAVAMASTNHQLRHPAQTLFMMFVTVGSFVLGSRVRSEIRSIVHPIITSTACTLLCAKIFGIITDQRFDNVLHAYRTGSFQASTVGAGDILLFMLGPAVISFAIAMYSRRMLIKNNMPVVGTAALTSSAGSLFGTAAYIRLINISSKTVRMSVLSRSVTTPLAMAITTLLGGNISIAASVVVMTGILATTSARSLCNALDIMDPVTRGLSVGAAGQALGASSLVHETDAFPFAAVSVVLTAVCATCLVSIPTVKDTLLKIALGPAIIA